MKRKAIIAMLMAAILIIGAVSVFALDYDVPEDATTVTSRFTVVEPEDADDEFAMVSEDGELVIYISEDTLIYFEDFVPLSDECEEMTQMVREVLFGRTLAEVLDGRNLRVIFEEAEQIEPISIMVLFEIAVAPGPEPIDLGIEWENGYDLDDNGYIGIMPLPEEIDWSEFDDFDPIVLNGEVVVNNEILENAPLPFLLETENGDVVMVPLRAVATALEYNVSWNGYLRSVQLGVAIHLWIGSTEVHFGRMAPLEISAAPVIVDSLTFVPLDFFRIVLGQTAYVFEGQVVIETYSDMM